MPKSPLARRDAETAQSALALRLEALGLTEDVLAEAVALHVAAMRGAMSTRGAVDWTARQRSATALLDLAGLTATPATGESGGGSGPLVTLNMVAPTPRPVVIEAEP